MNKKVVLVAFVEQDNLGVGYIAAVLSRAGFEPLVLDFRLGFDRLLEEILPAQPLMLGFSMIFQYHLREFADLVQQLRAAGLDCHFTAGGHYPSMRPQELFEVVPQLDSIVRFEGEHTCLELVEKLVVGDDWQNIVGLAHHADGRYVSNPLRPLESDLDTFPPPLRSPLHEYAMGKKYATLLASRGCHYDCVFCSIRRFYSEPPGPVKRFRDPAFVCREMELLHHERDCSIFMFQDDDFPLHGKRGREWTREFCALLHDKGLAKRIMWKISCRADVVEPEIFGLMKEAGLFLTYVGIESGSEQGLKMMNKRLTLDTNRRAIEVLDELGILVDFGFMLFDPESTFDSVGENLAFLRSICADGASAVTFCKMLPYAETEIEARLEAEGRIIGELQSKNYRFYDPKLDDFYDYVSESFFDWTGGHGGVLNYARWVRYFTAVTQRYQGDRPATAELAERARSLVADSNEYFLDHFTRMAATFGNGGSPSFGARQAANAEVRVAQRNFVARFEELLRDFDREVAA